MGTFFRSRNLLDQSKEFAYFIEHPLLTTEIRRSGLNQLLKNKVDPITLQFLLFLERKKRLSIVSIIAAEFDENYYDYKGIIKTTIICASALDPEQKNLIKARLEDKFNKKIETEEIIQPELLGGFKVIVGDRVLDFSLRTQLHRTKLNIINA